MCCQVTRGRGTGGYRGAASARGGYRKKKVAKRKPIGRPPKASFPMRYIGDSGSSGCNLLPRDDEPQLSSAGDEYGGGGGEGTTSPHSSLGNVNNGGGGVGGGGCLLVHRPVVPRKKETVNIEHLSEDLQQGYRIVAELMSDHHRTSNVVYIEALDLDPVRNREYLAVVERPMWLKRVKDKLMDSEYTNITQLVADIRLMLENAYRFYGPLHSFTKKGLRLEHVLEQKLALLPKETRELCSLEATSGKPVEEIKDTTRTKTAKITINGDNFFSRLLHRVKGCRAARDR